ncbi:hypothetical protein [Chryseobacterium populi]|uniref:Uncharacterized protein n=1 Tax=Chryseobacterium populi TaxID=1144316 RepID=J2KMM6_9FLAO|nr:hypothetical protein [Chryseobacterium populi]EJL74348.1 hypothetical protein PMI13_01087 [Chryseobacterium populi]
MKIKHSNRIEIFDTVAIVKLKKELLSRYRLYLKSGKNFDQWSETDDGFKYLLFDLLELQDGEVYIHIDGKATHWECDDNTDGFMIYPNIREIVLNGNNLTISFTNGEHQNFKFSKKYEHYEKLN